MSVASSKKLFLNASTWQSGLQVLSGLPYLPEMLPVWGHCADASSWVTFDYINLIILLLQQGAQDWTPKVWVLAGRTELCLEPSPLWVPRARNTRAAGEAGGTHLDMAFQWQRLGCPQRAAVSQSTEAWKWVTYTTVMC